jgi:hypothetical protein
MKGEQTNMLKMNYSDFKEKNYRQLVKECERRGIDTFDCRGLSMSADDLVGKIIAHDAYYEGRDDALNGRPSKIEIERKDNRRKYCLRCEDTDPYYLELTKEQYNFLNWCIRNGICLPYAEVDEISDVKWETP